MKYLTLSLSASLAAAAVLTAMPAHALYKCEDEQGVTYYVDTMTPQCAKKAITELSGQGSVVKQYEAPLTPEQLRAQADERERHRDTDKKVSEQKLRDFALISTYGSEREFDMARDKDLAALDARKRTLNSRNEDVDKTLAKLQNEMEFYKAGKSKSAKGKDGKDSKEGKEAPPQLVQDYNRAKADRTGLDTELTKVDADRAAVTARYDSEKTRWKKLKSGMPAGTLVDDKGEVVLAPEVPTQIVAPGLIVPGRPQGTVTCDGKTYTCSIGYPVPFACHSKIVQCILPK